jgi:hypothetical protein
MKILVSPGGSSRFPWYKPQSNKIFCPFTESKCWEPVTVWTAPLKVMRMSEPQGDYSGRLSRRWEQRRTVAFPCGDLYHSRESGQGQAILFSVVSLMRKKIPRGPRLSSAGIPGVFAGPAE